MTDVLMFEKDKGFVVEKLREGEFDYVDAGDEVFEAEFFQFIQARKYLKEMAETYPTPRKKEEVPVWFYLASNLSLRLHNEHRFQQYKYVVRCGGMLAGLGPDVGRKGLGAGDNIELSCRGFNEKNDYVRETPCDQDFLRKFSKDTRAEDLHRWFNVDAAKLWKKHKVYDRDGLFIGDGSYLFVPDNPAYEGSVKLLFDKHNHPVDAKNVRTEDIRKGDYQWRRCYKMVSIIHTDREGKFFVVVAVRVVPGNKHECPIFYEMLDEFISAVGDGVVGRMLPDRGFLDGERISHFKLKHGVDFLMPLRENMELYKDALSLASDARFQRYEPRRKEPVPGHVPERTKTEKIVKREATRRKKLDAKKAELPPPPPEKTVVRMEAAAIAEMRTWDTCTVPLTAVVCRDVYGDGHKDTWVLVDTAPVEDPARSRDDYAFRTSIEERHRQFKCFCDLTAFTSRAFSLVLNQVIFILLTYNLLQIYLLRNQKAELNRSPFPQMQKRLLPAASWIIVYCEEKVAFLTQLEYSEILLTLEETARSKALKKTRRLISEFADMLRSGPS